MSSDYEFEDDLADIPLDALDAAEAEAIAQSQRVEASSKNTNRRVVADTSFDDLTFNFDEAELQKLDQIVEDRYAGRRPEPVAGPSRTRQTTLTGEIVEAQEPSSTQLQFQTRKAKIWDQTAYAATGKLRKKPRGRKKGEADSDEEADEPVEFEQFPDAQELAEHIQPMKLEPDLEAGLQYIYPLNHPKRDYQYNIVKKCFFDNTLVSLPTGLGKTFIAGVVMLNFYRWFPEGKIIFMAPTKPLVDQQIQACHESSGIPGKDAVQITGETSQDKRSRSWNLKRVFFATPQTVANDIINDLCDPRDIALLVIDEAHRGNGDSAYAQVVRLIMRRNPHFRILALTATPASTPDAVQGIVDSLHISHIETRLEDSFDIRRYLHKKEIKTHIIEMSSEVKTIQEPLLKLIESLRAKAKSALYKMHKPSISLHPFAIRKVLDELSQQRNWGPYTTVHQLWRCVTALSHLMEVSIEKCYSYFKAIEEGAEPEEGAKSNGKKTQRDKGLLNNPLTKEVIQALEAQKDKGFSHPKIEQTRNLLVQYFGAQDEAENSTKAMIFTTLRQCVDEIVENLRDMQPLIRVSRFVGQSQDVKGNKGMAQKEQKQAIKDFKAGVFNVLVATSIGEEGLDIGEVDFIICYDAQKAPIKMLQRIGRTGRKRNGYVHVLLSEHREEMNFEQAKVTHKEIQKIMQNGTVELYADVARMLPDHIRPAPLERVMEIRPYDHEKEFILRDEGSPVKGTKRKRANNVDRSPVKGTKRKRVTEVPVGAVNGFVKASQLKVKKQRKSIEKDFDEAGEDDSDDMDIASGVLRRAASMIPSTTKPMTKSTTKAAGLRKTKTQADSSEKPAKKPRKKKVKESNPEPDVEDEKRTSYWPGLEGHEPEVRREGPSRRSSSPEIVSVPPPAKVKRKPASNDDSSLEHATSTSLNSEFTLRSPRAESPELTVEAKRKVPQRLNAVVPPPPAESKSPIPPRHPSPRVGADMSWLLEDSDDGNMDILIISSSPELESRPAARVSHSKRQSTSQDENSILSIGSSSPIKPVDKRGHRASSMGIQSPPIVSRSDPSLSPILPDPTQPVINKHRKRKTPDSSIDLSSPLVHQPLNRLRRPRSPSVENENGSGTLSPTIPRPRRRLKKAYDQLRARSNLILNEATHSGDEVSEGSSHPSEDEENEEDREFLRELPATQMPDSYDQSQVYRESLLSQAPPGFGRGPTFTHAPIRRGRFGVRGGAGGQGGYSTTGVYLSSSPRRGDEEPDEYEFGSFVVDDSAEILYSDDLS